MTTTGDPLSPVSNSRPLETAAGAGDLLRMLYVRTQAVIGWRVQRLVGLLAG
ncbi:MAG: hypothetical protein JWO75_1217 [Actinomycetia bacterium]|jgi:hypothetical protein|nr:hypothetical protein [Actinomycetes bacterium]